MSLHGLIESCGLCLKADGIPCACRMGIQKITRTEGVELTSNSPLLDCGLSNNWSYLGYGTCTALGAWHFCFIKGKLCSLIDEIIGFLSPSDQLLNLSRSVVCSAKWGWPWHLYHWVVTRVMAAREQFSTVSGPTWGSTHIFRKVKRCSGPEIKVVGEQSLQKNKGQTLRASREGRIASPVSSSRFARPGDT